MGKYLQSINEIIAREVNRLDHALLYGENLDRGSFLSGLSKNLASGPTRRILNVGNCEYTHCGVGFGAMLGGANAVLFVKQLDFMLLGMDHFVSTYHLLRSRGSTAGLGSFTIVVAVYDQGYQGPQSSFNDLASMCSMARASGFTLTNLADAAAIAAREIHRPGFRILALTQKSAGDETFAPEAAVHAEDCSIFRYFEGTDLSLVCANFSLRNGLILRQSFEDRGISCSLFNVNPVLGQDWQLLASDAERTGAVLILDDTKGLSGLGHQVFEFVSRCQARPRVHLVTRPTAIPFGISTEEFVVPSVDELTAALGLCRAGH
jgi:pyruvate/2-oxoglutarate/acetoin dehydrogenase E1 component